MIIFKINQIFFILNIWYFFLFLFYSLFPLFIIFFLQLSFSPSLSVYLDWDFSLYLKCYQMDNSYSVLLIIFILQIETFPRIGSVRVKHRGFLLTLEGTVIGPARWRCICARNARTSRFWFVASTYLFIFFSPTGHSLADIFPVWIFLYYLLWNFPIICKFM